MQCPVITRDMNGDGVQTISDLWLMLGAAFHWPGDRVVEAISRDAKAARFLELSFDWCGGWISFGISCGAWFALLFVVMFVLAFINEIGLTIGRLFEAWRK